MGGEDRRPKRHERTVRNSNISKCIKKRGKIPQLLNYTQRVINIEAQNPSPNENKKQFFPILDAKREFNVLFTLPSNSRTVENN